VTKSHQLSDDAVDLIGIATHMVNLDGSPDQWVVGAYTGKTTSVYERPEIKTKGRGELWFGKARDQEEAADVIGLLIEKGCTLDDRSDPAGHLLYFVRREKKRQGSRAQPPYSPVDHVREAGLKIVADFARFKSVTKRAADRGRRAEDSLQPRPTRACRGNLTLRGGGYPARSPPPHHVARISAPTVCSASAASLSRRVAFTPNDRFGAFAASGASRQPTL